MWLFLESLFKVLKIITLNVGKPHIELIMEYQKEYRKIEIRNQRIQNEMNYNFVQSEKTEHKSGKTLGLIG